MPYHLLEFTFLDHKAKRKQISKNYESQRTNVPRLMIQVILPVSEIHCTHSNSGVKTWPGEAAGTPHTLSFIPSSLITLSSKAFIMIRSSPASGVMDFLLSNSNRKLYLPWKILQVEIWRSGLFIHWTNICCIPTVCQRTPPVAQR